ncbi:3-hydroxyisobutyrate dehydrogenase [Phytomonospora endophytica]|uniref:3-hydroxyisobutyrate dehydrogenase n=2 Tax=Phytomonospora endophytica TaxID=714109 RepID=A0A841FSI0_9ACTN|nr:3-hydroxyisobutyrate dehydrogenase [Phytomonospora endophytica]GIG70634.1 3-hydroxyisobutyrate dehydrogenase [Phytomonospora endophytica]
MSRIAVLGLGRMGAAMTRRLLATGHQVTVWNRTAAKAEPLREAGASVAGTPARAVAEAEVVISMLSGPEALEAVMDEALAALPDGCALAEMSTVGPGAARALAARLPEGVTMVDAPVMGSVDKAETGTLTILVGGDGPPPVLAELGTVVHCGPIGSGAAMKLVVNAGMITAVTALAETLALADRLGLPADLVEKTLAAGPLAAVLTRARSTTAAFPIAHAAKDLALAEAATGAAYPVAEAVRAVLATTDGDADLGAVVAHVRTTTGSNT